MEELDAALSIITETWLSDGQHLEDDRQDLLLGAGLSMINRNRPRNMSTGLAHGGVALFFREEICTFKEIPFPNPDGFEVLVAAGSIQGHTRKILVIACYMPPNYLADRANKCLDYLYEIIIELKRRYKDPYLVISGDFNQWDVARAVEEFRDITEIDLGPTRGSRTIDRTFTNFEKVTESGVLSPLQTDGEDGHIRRSDHGTTFLSAVLNRKDKYRWLTYTYRYNNKESADKFGEWLVANKWEGVLEAVGSEAKAVAYQSMIDQAIAEFFPLRTVKRRNIDPPWINGYIKRLIKRRKRIYKESGGRTEEWKKMKKKVRLIIEKRRNVYQESQKEALLAEDSIRNFFKNTKNYMSKQRPAPFDIMNMFPGRSEEDVSELLAQHFNAIGSEFSPLEAHEIPTTYNKSLPLLQVYEVAGRLRKFKKPKSVVRGDIFPGIVTKYSDFLAIPLTSIYNSITQTNVWPARWKEESVTVIPKTRTPTEIGQLRNISCTLLVSKVYESYVLQWALEQVKLKDNQFGGAKGCSTAHLLISIWQKILADLEDCRAATLLTAIDYAKAFNRMSFQECLKSFARHGASNQIIRLVAAFLSQRTMQVKVGNTWSRKRSVSGGVPQGSILGVLLFNITTDNLEDDPEDLKTQRLRPDTSPPRQQAQDGGPTFSTPVRQEQSVQDVPDLEITPLRIPMNSRGFIFLSNARNIPEDLDRTMLRDTTLPSEPNPKTSAIWKDRPSGKHKYVDDGIIDSKLNMETVDAEEVEGKLVKDKRAISAQNMFRRVVYNAEAIGMRVNTSKTNQICVSDSLSFTATAHIRTGEGERIGTSNTMKVLGFTFGSRPNCSAHMETVRRSVRGRYWLLIHLKQNGFSESELVRVYVTMIRPILEYCVPVYHSMLTDREDEQLERLQATALRYVYGFGISYSNMREMAGIDTLRSRRIVLCDKFANKCVRSDRFSGWFPLHAPGRRSRHTEKMKYAEEFARCDRLRNSPLFYMRRRLNGKVGKNYGKRNCQYRDT